MGFFRLPLSVRCGCGGTLHATSLPLHVLEFQDGLGRQWHRGHVLVCVVAILCGRDLITLMYFLLLFFLLSFPLPPLSFPLPLPPYSLSPFSLPSPSPLSLLSLLTLSLSFPLPPLALTFPVPPLSLPSPFPLPLTPLTLPFFLAAPLSSNTSALSFSTQLPNEVLSDPGSDVTLTCASAGSSNVEWLYNGEPIDGATGNSYTVENVTQSTSGYYQCRIGGTVRGSIVSSSYVHTASISVSGESCALLGSQHELVCTFEYPVKEMDFRWLQNGMPVSSDGRSVIVTRSGGVSESRLIIDSVQGGDGGVYTCEVRVVGSDHVLTDTFQVTLVGECVVYSNSQ